MNPDRQCTATSAQSGERCRKPAILGHHVCAYHGGSSPQVKRAAARRLAEERARRALDQVDVEEITNPLQAFADLISEAEALRKMLAAHVAALDSELRATNNRWGTEQMRAEYQALERAFDRSGRLLEAWVRLGIDERRLAIAEMARDFDAAVILGTLRALGLDTGSPRVQQALDATYTELMKGAA